MRMAAFVLGTMWGIGRYIMTTLVVSSIARLQFVHRALLTGSFCSLQSSLILTLSASKLAYGPCSNSRSSSLSKSRPVSLILTTGSLAPSSSPQAASNKSQSGTIEIESIPTPRPSVTPTPATPLASAFAPNLATSVIKRGG
jgi:hypothetical protein